MLILQLLIIRRLLDYALAFLFFLFADERADNANLFIIMPYEVKAKFLSGSQLH